MKLKRQEFQTIRSVLDPRRFVFLDETWVKTNMTRLYGWGPVGQRIVERVPHGHWKTTMFVAAMRSTGLFAPMVVDGPMTPPLKCVTRCWPVGNRHSKGQKGNKLALIWETGSCESVGVLE